MSKSFKPVDVEPIYKKIADAIEEKILEGALKPGDKLPSENELCKQFKVSRITVRQSLNSLAQKDLIYSIHGKGTFVKIADIKQELSTIVRFSTALSREDVKGYTKVLQLSDDVHIAKATAKLQTEEYFNLFLLGHIIKTPVVYYKSYILNEYKKVVYKKVKELEKSNKAFTTLDIYDSLGIKITSIKQNVSAVSGNGKSGEILKLGGNQALLRLESTYYVGKKAIEYKTAYYRSDVYSFELNRNVSFE